MLWGEDGIWNTETAAVTAHLGLFAQVRPFELRGPNAFTLH